MNISIAIFQVLPWQMFRKAVQDFESAQQKAIINQRKDHIYNQCRNLSRTKYWSELTSPGTLWTYKNISYCVTPRAGSTFWKQTFRFMALDFIDRQMTISRPSDIDRLVVHYGPIRNITVTPVFNVLTNTNNMSLVQGFMFARDPYARLWSTYIDKFLLPDFWSSYAVLIAKFTRRISDFDCVNDISFEEFLTYITYKPVENMDEHWAPIHRLCNPCHVTYDVIGKTETFEADSKYIADKLFPKKLDDEIGQTQNVRNIEMLIRYMFELHYVRYRFVDCFQLLDVAKRLWISLQLRGNIHVRSQFPELSLLKKGFHSNPAKVLTKIVTNVIETQSEEMRRELKTQEYKLLVEAYKHIPKPVLGRLKQIYHYDFQLFQYNEDLDLS